MTKSEEIDALVKFTKSLPKDSYLWPWLMSVQAQVVQDIRNDFVVSPSLTETREDCASRIKRAEEEAANIVACGRALAEKFEREAKEFAENRRNQVRSYHDELMNTLHAFSHRVQNI